MTEYSQTYWNKLIEQYKSGSITEQDRFVLEKKALDDPFLFDALEGYALYQNIKQEEKKTAAIFTLPRIAIAASIVIIIAFVFNLNTSNSAISEEQSPIAMVMEEESEDNSIGEETISDEKNEVESTASEVVTDNNSSIPQKTLPEKRERAKKVEAEKSNVQVVVPEKVEEEASSFENKDEEIMAMETQVKEVDAKVLKEVDFDKPKKEIQDRTVDGIKVEGIQDVAVDSKLKEVAKDEDPSQKLNMRRNSLVGAQPSSEKKKLVAPISYYEAVPVIGKKIFDDYAKERIDQRGMRQNKPQEVTIEFTIDKNGNLSNFHHIFTGCSECGPFAIAILQNSGEWKTVPPGFSGRARYTFTF